MNLFKVNFQELYERHLCRHSQYGINVIHLLTVIWSYLAIFGILAQFVEPEWLLLAIPLVYFVALAFNLPLRVLATGLLFVALFFLLFFALALLPVGSRPLTWWPRAIICGLCLIVLVLSHRVQNWSHKIYTVERDMTKFNTKYKKGPTLFLLLSLYELPILLNYLAFDRKSWVAGDSSEPLLGAPKIMGAGTASTRSQSPLF